MIEVKGNLSYSTIKQIDTYYQENGAEYNVLVVYFKKTVTNYPVEETNEQEKKLIYFLFNDLKKKFKKKTGKNKDDYYAERAKKGDWKEDRKDIIKKAQEAALKQAEELQKQQQKQLEELQKQPQKQLQEQAAAAAALSQGQ